MKAFSPQIPVMCLSVLRVRKSVPEQSTTLALLMPTMVRKETMPTLWVPYISEDKSSFYLVSELPRNLRCRNRELGFCFIPVTALRDSEGTMALQRIGL